MDAHSQIEPRRGYAICTEARSGSVFLSHLLRSTGRLGKPWEFFHDPAVARAVVADPEAELLRLAREAATPNGVYGLKVFTPHFDMVVGARWAERLPGLAFVHLSRRDLLAQAISLARALQTGQYKGDQPPGAAPLYDRAQIADCLARIAWGQARWESWFARNGIEPLRLVYEEVAAAPQAAVDAVARLVGLDGPVPVDASQVAVRVQRDAATLEWRERFVRETGDISYLDGGRLFSRLRRGGAFARWFLGPR
jgi:LPS sulfotransferase NodH